MKSILRKIIDLTINIKVKFNPIILLISLVFNSLNYFSQNATFRTIGSGSWGNSVGSPGSPWSIISGSDVDGIPDLTDTVEILNSHTIDVLSSSNTSLAALRLNNGGVLNLNPSYKLVFYNYGTTSIFNGTVNNGGTLWFARGTNIEGTGTITSADVLIQYYNTTLNSDLTFNGTIVLSASGTLTISSTGNLTLNGPIRTGNGSSVINNGTITVNTSSFFTLASFPSTTSLFSSNGNIVWNNTSTFKIPADGAYKNITINAATSCASDFNASGDWTNNSTFSSSTAGNNITFNGSSSQSFSGSGTNNFKKLTLDNSNGLQLSSGTINIEEVMESTSGTFTQNGANVVLKSTIADNAGIIKVNNSSDYSYSSGSFNVERFYNASSNGWRMISSPVKNSTLADVDDEFIFCGVNGTSAGNNFSYAGCGNFYNVLTYNEATDDYSEVTNVNQSISSGNGTLIYTSSGAKTLNMGGARSPNFDAISYPITRNGPGYNLISNPYPATLDWSVFQGANSIQNAHWIFSGDAGNFLSSTNNIPHSQGFFVNANSSGNISFNVNQTINSQASFVKSVNGINLPLSLKITSDQNSYFDYAHIEANANFSSAYDSSYEISKLYSPYPDYAPNIFFLDYDNNDLDRICINNNQDIDLFFDVKVGALAHGNYTLNFENISNFMIGSCISIEDLHTGISTDLRLDSNFTFMSDSTAISPRFKMTVEVDYDIHVTNSTCFQDSSAFVKLFGTSIHGSYFNLLDSTGLVVDSVIANGDSLLFDNLNSGVFNFSTNHSGRCSVDNQEIVILEPENVISNFITATDTFFIDSGNINIYFNNNSLGSSAYLWDFGDGTFSNQINPMHTFIYPGVYTVELTAFNDSSATCSDSFTKTVVVINNPFTNVFEHSNNQNLISYNNNFLNIYSSKMFEQIKIYDLSGRELLSTNYNNRLPLQLSKGIYIVKLINSESSYTQKVYVNTIN
jgi:PKD repeat protein